MIELGLMNEQRIQKIRKGLIDEHLDGFLISNFYNIFYLTGFKTLTTDEREAFVFVTKDSLYLFTDARYDVKNPVLKVRLIEANKGLLTHLQEIIEEESVRSLAFEAEDMLFLEYQKIKEYISKVRLIPVERLMMKLREIKDDREIEAIKKACEIGDQCLEEIMKTVKLEQSEKEIAFKIEMWLKEKGYDSGFDPIVAVDANSAIPHYSTKDGQGRVKKDSVILIDFGVKYKDYLSDMTRMFFSSKPNTETMNTYIHLLHAQTRTVEKISKAESPSAIDIFCRKQLTDKQLPAYPHSTGHGVGLEIHEYPKISFNSRDAIKDNQVFTIEPGVYMAGKYGMRIEDSIVIKDGKAEVLTNFPKNLMVL